MSVPPGESCCADTQGRAVVCPAPCGWKVFATTFWQIVWNVHAREAVAGERAFGNTHNLKGIPAAAENLPLARILVVDDDVAVQSTVRLLLERAGHSVVTAGDGSKGLSLSKTGDFDLLFLDIFMPGMDGFETMRMVRQQHPLMPIIVISGRPISPEPDAPDFLTMATKLGAVSSLQKPFRPADLLAAVTGCLEAAAQSSPSSRPSGGVASCG
jgi:CheY-like chemotaxis protein